MNPSSSSWDKKEWIKDVLSKSGTDIVEIKDDDDSKSQQKDSRNKMVYYPSLPLITKTEQQQRQQLCSPLNGETQIYHLPMQTSASSSSSSLSSSSQLHLMQQASTVTLNGHHHQNGVANGSATLLASASNQNFIKLEQSPALSRQHNLQSLSESPSPASSSSSSSSSSPLNNNGAGVNSNRSGNLRQSTPTNKPQFKCDQCNMMFGSKSAHTSHIKSHKNTKEHIMNSLGTAPSGLINQQQLVLPASLVQVNATANGNGSDPYQCNVCQKTFAVPARLIRHYRTHTGERPFECEFCHKMFSVKENLQVHRRIHTKERPYKCDVCGRAFEHSGKLHRHMRIHTGERPHKCSVCSKTFIQSGQLVIHMRTHTGEKPYKCPVDGCGKGFTCSKQLKVHSRTHTGEKPYHCDICFRDFGYNHVLKLHKVQHYGSKCYKCTICDETFKSKKEMEAHIKGHANELPDDDDDTQQSQNSQQQSPIPQQQQQQQQQQQSPIPQQLVGGQNNHNINNHNNNNHNNNNNTNNNNIIKQETSSRFAASSSSSCESRIIPETDKNHDDCIEMHSPVPILSHQQHSNPNANATTITYENDNDGISVSDGDLVPIQIQHHKLEYVPSNLNGSGNIDGDSNSNSNSNVNCTNNRNRNRNRIRNDDNCDGNNSLYNKVYQQFEQSTFNQNSHPTINPALLVAASIASRRDEEANNMRMGMTSPPPTSLSNESAENSSETHDLNEYYKMTASQDEDNDHVNQPIDCYSNSQQYRYDSLLNQRTSYYAPAPVAEFKPSLRHNEIVRQVEAAIAGAGLSPPRSTSTESPERSSSPESDTMMMADRDVMTLPLRKRKLYLNDNQSSKDVPPVVRISSVIQFAKAS